MSFETGIVGARPAEAFLMHHGIRGMKHGRRRFQNEDGTWTEAGLEARRKREGFGEERKAKRQEKKAARAEKRQERKAARKEARAEFAERQRKKKLSNLSDEELKAKIERMKLEAEYKDLKQSPLTKAGIKFVSDYFQNRRIKEERAYNAKQEKLSREHEMAKLKEQTEQTKLRSEADKERAKADTARAQADKIDIEKGTRMVKLKNEGKSLKLQGKRFRADNTIIGGARKMINKILSGKGEQTATVLKGYGESQAAYNRGVTDARIAKKQNKILTRRNRKLKPGEDKASISGGDKNYFDSNSNDENKKKKKKGGGN